MNLRATRPALLALHDLACRLQIQQERYGCRLAAIPRVRAGNAPSNPAPELPCDRATQPLNCIKSGLRVRTSLCLEENIPRIWKTGSRHLSPRATPAIPCNRHNSTSGGRAHQISRQLEGIVTEEQGLSTCCRVPWDKGKLPEQKLPLKFLEFGRDSDQVAEIFERPRTHVNSTCRCNTLEAARAARGIAAEMPPVTTYNDCN
ncbi:hypothetical protein LMG27952_07579 [Paraburkholderia hiiakae]|uniref:Uncharacterized protein n=1 Tax=Paraburkholderia hiiakae TaxID=1081782 RepID=A0ABM8PBE8_9BURK|nr:hypothetical protein LMG27952_07579 [Paraburkholderia hiiakae]